MKTIAVEEHFVTPAVQDAWNRAGDAGPVIPGARGAEIAERLVEVGPRRIAAMDEAGVDVQVISLTAPGLQNLSADVATGLQGETNDAIAALVGAHPDRFTGFATLATPAPEAAAAELERAVRTLGLQGAHLFGRTGERNLDHADNWPIFEAADALGAPIYLHPQTPQAGVCDAIYSGFDPGIASAFSTVGIGWHYEAGIQFLRLALSGVLDRFPHLQIILGHWGEVVLFYLDRADALAQMAGLPRRFSEYIAEQAYITPGGIYSERYLRWALEIVGPDRILFATDYPYQPGPDGGVEHFLTRAGLGTEPASRIAAGNWEQLIGGIRR